MLASEPKFLTYSETAKVLRCSERTVAERVKAGKIESVLNGRLRLFPLEAIEAYIQQNMCRTQSEAQNPSPN